MDRTEARQLLTTELDRLTRSRSTLADQIALTRAAQEGSPQDSTELSEQISDRMDVASELATVDAQLADVLAALQRLESGTYGVCVDCGEPIADERLRTVPDAIRCTAHQARNDAERPHLSA